MAELIQIAWDRFQIIGRITGDYIARLFATLFYYVLLIPFALIAQFIVDPLDTRQDKPIWKPRKPVGTSLEEARNQS